MVVGGEKRVGGRVVIGVWKVGFLGVTPRGGRRPILEVMRVGRSTKSKTVTLSGEG